MREKFAGMAGFRNIVWFVIGLVPLLMIVSIVLWALGGFFSGNPEDYILDDAELVYLTDYERILEASQLPAMLLEGYEDVRDYQDHLYFDWEDRMESVGTDPDDVEVVLAVFITGQGFGYRIVSGDFDFGSIRDWLDERGFHPDSYRDMERWRYRDGFSVSLFENRGLYLYGVDEPVRDALRALDRGSGLMDGESDFRKAMELSGDGYVGQVNSNCGGSGVFGDLGLIFEEAGGCAAVSFSLMGGDQDDSEVMVGVAFRSERRADSEGGLLKGYLERSRTLDVDVEESSLHGEVVRFDLTIYED